MKKPRKVVEVESAFMAVIVKDEKGKQWVCNHEVKLCYTVPMDSVIEFSADMVIGWDKRGLRRFTLFRQVAINGLKFMSLHKENKK